MGAHVCRGVNRMFRRLAWRGSPAGILMGFMDDQIIGLQDWLATPVGSYLLDWEQKQLGAVVADAFGFHALQLGIPALDALRSNRMPHRWLADQQAETSAPLRCALVTDFAACLLPQPAWTCWFCPMPWNAAAIRMPPCAKWSASWCPMAAW